MLDNDNTWLAVLVAGLLVLVPLATVASGAWMSRHTRRRDPEVDDD